MSTDRGRLRLLLVIDSLGSGGAQRQVVSLASGLAERGHQVELFNYYPHHDHFRGELQRSSISIFDADKRHRFDFGPLCTLRRILRDGKYDAALSLLDTPNLYLLLAAAASVGTKIVVSERLMFADGRLTFRTWAKYQFYRRANAITANSEHQRVRILAKFPWSQGRLLTIWNGVDLNAYKPRLLWNPNSNRRMAILAVGTVEPRKNAYNLIKAVRLALDKGSNLIVHWAGKTSTTPAGYEEYERCCSLINALKLNENWRWLGECGEMNMIYPQYDLLVHPSFTEGLPNVICEGLACGLPVLASDVGDHALLVNSGNNGWLFDPHSPESIASSLFDATSLPDSARELMSQNARQFAAAKLGLDKLVDNYESLLFKICATPYL